jgi:hypothetical protein
MERDNRKRVIKEFPDKEDVSHRISSLFVIAKEYFEEKKFQPKIVIEQYSNNGDISVIAFLNLTREISWELSQKIIASRPHAWGHIEGLLDNENEKKSWIRLYEDLAYVPKR